MVKWYVALGIVLFAAWYFFHYKPSIPASTPAEIEEAVDAIDMGIWNKYNK